MAEPASPALRPAPRRRRFRAAAPRAMIGRSD